MVFKDYAKYYDLIYSDKEYEKEARYIDGILKNTDYKNCFKLLELGSGTGAHASLLSDLGYNVLGIERSVDMINISKKRNKVNVSFIQSDIRDFFLNKKFDAVFSLFHVLSYLNNLNDFIKVLKLVNIHLNEGAYFIFDTWYGPAVLSQQPNVRVKRIENDEMKITRIAEPILNEAESTVEVNYEMFVQNKYDASIKCIHETHSMRYYFLSEIELCLAKTGFILKDSFEFMTGKKISKNTWGSCFLAKKIKNI